MTGVRKPRSRSARRDWVADAVMIIRAAGADLNWARFVESVERRGLGFPIWESIRYLADLVDVPVPEEVVGRAPSVTPTGLERKVYSIRPGQGEGNESMKFLPTLWYKAKILGSREGLPGRTRWLVESLKETWGIDETWKMPFVVVGRAVRKLRQVVGGGER